MKFRYHKSFQKQLLKLSPTKQELCKERLILFSAHSDHPLLYKHFLKGKYNDHCSLSAGGDLRMIYREVGSDEVELVAIGTHSQLYK